MIKDFKPKDLGLNTEQVLKIITNPEKLKKLFKSAEKLDSWSGIIMLVSPLLGVILTYYILGNLEFGEVNRLVKSIIIGGCFVGCILFYILNNIVNIQLFYMRNRAIADQ